MILLYPTEFIHIQNNDTAQVRTEIGPKRIVLKSNEQQLGDIFMGKVVGENQYAIVKNPWDATQKKYLMGQRKVIQGPTILYLQYQEALLSINKVHVLTRNQALRLEVLQPYDKRVSGEVYQVRGPLRFIPRAEERVLRTIEATLVNQNHGIYVKNTDTSELRLVKGPCAYLLKANEEYYYKQYSVMEQAALNLPSKPSYRATVIQLVKGEVLCVLDRNEKERYILGPSSVRLLPEESVKVLHLSAGKPKRPGQIYASKIKMDANFCSDKFEITTKDGATLSLLVSYKWEFVCGRSEVFRLFKMVDFIGYVCSSLCSRVREEAAGFTFEEFQTGTVGTLRKALFNDLTVSIDNKEHNFHGLLFDEIKLLVTEIDVKEMKPTNPEINRLLNETIKSNMKILCQKMEQDAERKAKKQKVLANAEISNLELQLIDAKNTNLKLRSVEKAKIDGQLQILQAEGVKEKNKIEKEGKINLQVEKMKKTIELLATEEGQTYLSLLKAQKFAELDQQWVVGTDSKIQLGL